MIDLFSFCSIFRKLMWSVIMLLSQVGNGWSLSVILDRWRQLVSHRWTFTLAVLTPQSVHEEQRERVRVTVWQVCGFYFILFLCFNSLIWASNFRFRLKQTNNNGDGELDPGFLSFEFFIVTTLKTAIFIIQRFNILSVFLLKLCFGIHFQAKLILTLIFLTL